MHKKYKYLLIIMFIFISLYIIIQSTDIDKFITNNLIKLIFGNILLRKLIGHMLINFIFSILIIMIINNYNFNKYDILLINIYLGIFLSIVFELVQLLPKDRIFSYEDIFINYFPYICVSIIYIYQYK